MTTPDTCLAFSIRYEARMIAILLFMFACSEPNDSISLTAADPELSLSPQIASGSTMLPGETQELALELVNVGGSRGSIEVSLEMISGDAMYLQPLDLDEIEAEEQLEVVVVIEPTTPGPQVAYLHATVNGAADCNEVWAVVRTQVIDDSCGPDDLDCDGQTSDVDCEDDNSFVGVGFAEVCDSKDNDCDMQVDANLDCNNFCGHPGP